MKLTEEMRLRVAKTIGDFIAADREAVGAATRWRRPLVGFADARGEGFRRLRSIVTEKHYMPEDFLPDATVVVSYFLPFSEEIPDSNVDGRPASQAWATAYNETNAMAVRLNDHLADVIKSWGYRAAVPQNTLTIPEILKSYWSQRHIAYLAGLGTFGLNNMMITDMGCCGRIFSVVSDLPITPDRPREREACLFKRDGTCGLCVRRCPSGALTKEGFDRVVCQETCRENRGVLGAGCCGKCLVGLPCSVRLP